MIYSYHDLTKDMHFLSSSELETGSIGKTVCGRELFFVFFKSIANSEKSPVIITGGIHAREHITSYFLVKLIKYFFEAKVNFSQGVYFLPMLNPDGIMLIKDGLKSIPQKLQPIMESVTKDSKLSLLKANANCVDLNVNFDARWGEGKSNLTHPHFENYIGKKPFSEIETSALRNFTLQKKPSVTFSYHAKGQELYWEFGQQGKGRKQDLKLAKRINRYLKYKLIPDTKTSAGGYKDWCIEKLQIPSFTIEIVNDKHKHPLTDYSVIEKEFPRHIKMFEDVLTKNKL